MVSSSSSRCQRLMGLVFAALLAVASVSAAPVSSSTSCCPSSTLTTSSSSSSSSANPSSTASPSPTPSSSSSSSSAQASGTTSSSPTSSGSSSSSSAKPSSTSSANAPLNTTSSSGSGNSSLSSLSGSLQDSLRSLLASIGEGATERFVIQKQESALGSDDDVASNKELSDIADHTFTGDPTKPGNEGYVAQYAEFLVAAGQWNVSSLKDKFDIIDGYYKGVEALQDAQKLLMAAYQNATGTKVTNIGVQLNGTTVDQLTIHQMEKWAADYVGVHKRDGGNKSKEPEKPKKPVFYTKDNYTSYLSANDTVTKSTPGFRELDEGMQLSYQGYFLKEPVMTQPPATFNLSMAVEGDPDSPNAVFAPAWSAIIVNTTNTLANVLQDNLNDGLSNSTVSDTPFASSINSEAPKSTSSTSSSSHTGSASSTSQTGTSSSSSPASSSSSSSAAPTTSNKSRRRNRIRLVRGDAPTLTGEPSAPTPFHWILDSRDNSTKSNSTKSDKNPKKKASPALNAVAAKSKNDTTPGKNSTQTPDAPVSTLMVLALQPGAWWNRNQEFIKFAAEHAPDVFLKYFGKDGSGPLGTMWTHVILQTTFKHNSTDLQTIQLIGKVYDKHPIFRLKDITLPTSSSNSSSNSTSKQ